MLDSILFWLTKGNLVPEENAKATYQKKNDFEHHITNS